MDQPFEEKCLGKRTITIEPSVFPIKSKEQQETIILQHKNNAAYFLESATSLLDTTTPLVAILIAYFSMEHKANQLLALYGYKVESHVCTQIGLSKIIQRKDLAKMLSDIFTLRQNIGYRMTLTQSPESKREAEHIIKEILIPFTKEIDKLAQETK
ncbi:MAG: hypothetical protein A2912_06245 [Candidatus Buchananbacteria bacterium RIFCSPLOWO2_01_FULL_40_23b]|uniref:HEPN domain-containing protein n=1 Tax=Candidatus Buchananbacteria bacterium RIFCSPLOWO2_01_FULL_40_23b TaxID=1797544 RepID=A0A1G1YTK5_9BACT|nr:MAG: hypothetical protein A2912_06245 [Candidatus Buchananbacteria bacterium RIFCSPLOWO2_01_FULL_40_23b]